VIPVIAVSNLGKRYGRTVAVDDVSLEVFEGEIFGLIGPNGAGKTTTMECVEGSRVPDKGTRRRTSRSGSRFGRRRTFGGRSIPAS
jgi:ABC-type multidrug transport system ATPase subunit